MGGCIDWRLIPRDAMGRVGPLCTPCSEKDGRIRVLLRHAEEIDRKKTGNRAGIEFADPSNPNANLFVPISNILVMSGTQGHGKRATGACTRLQRRLKAATDQFWRLHDESDPGAIQELFRLQDAIVEYECKNWREMKARYWDTREARRHGPMDPEMANMARRMIEPMARRIFPNLISGGRLLRADEQ